jgi:transposase
VDILEMKKLMSQKEATRAQILGLVDELKISQKEAAKRLNITSRQVRRLIKRYHAEGLPGLISKKRGQVSNRRTDEATKATAIELIGTHYPDFGPTLVAEKLTEKHKLRLSVETVRQLMIVAGYWHPKKGSKICTHPMRERRGQLGELIQIDGSPHDWFEGRSEKCTLLVFIDDATGKLTQLRFVKAETTLAYLHVLYDHIVTYGVPVALYSDKHSIFRINAKDADPDAETQFARAARELGIMCIHANSPQAKGRVERANQTLQDRLVKEMRLVGIDDKDAANAWLPDFIADYNQRFAVTAKSPIDAHVPYQDSKEALTRILSVQITRTLSKNLSCQYENKLLQIETIGTGLALRKAKITLHEHFDGRTELFWQGHRLTYTLLDKTLRQASEADAKTVNTRVSEASATRTAAHKPAANHPWRNAVIGQPGNLEKRVIGL